MSAVSPNANIPDGSKGAATCLLCSLLILCEIKRIWRESFIRKKTMHTECFLCFPQKAQKSQNYARALLVLACIAGYFSGTQKYAKYADFCGLLRSRWPPDGFLFLTTNLHGSSLMHASLTRVMQGLFYSHTKSTKFTKAYAHCLYIASGNAC